MKMIYYWETQTLHSILLKLKRWTEFMLFCLPSSKVLRKFSTILFITTILGGFFYPFCSNENDALRFLYCSKDYRIRIIFVHFGRTMLGKTNLRWERNNNHEHVATINNWQLIEKTNTADLVAVSFIMSDTVKSNWTEHFLHLVLYGNRPFKNHVLENRIWKQQHASFGSPYNKLKLIATINEV